MSQSAVINALTHNSWMIYILSENHIKNMYRITVK